MKVLILLILLSCSSFVWGTTFYVLDNSDSGPGSLRQAIIDANADVNEPHLISFATFSGIKEIILKDKTLPYINRAMVIDATTHPLYNSISGIPIISINGMNLENDGLNRYFFEYDNLKVFNFKQGSEGSSLIGFEIFDEYNSDPATSSIINAVEIDKVDQISILNNVFHDLLIGIKLIGSKNCQINQNKSNQILSFLYSYLNCEGSISQENEIFNSDSHCYYINGSGLHISRNIMKETSEPYAIIIQNKGALYGTGSDNKVSLNEIDNFVYGVGVQTPLQGSLIDPYTGNVLPSSYMHGESKNNLITENLFTQIGNKAILLNYTSTTFPGNVGKPTPIINQITHNGDIHGTAEPYDKIEIFASNNVQESEVFLQSVQADINGFWAYNFGSNIGYTHISLTATDINGANYPFNENTSEMTSIVIPVIQCPTNNCEYPIDIVCGVQETIFAPCDICGASNSSEFWYTYTATEGDIITVEELATDYSGNPYNFDYVIYELNQGSSTCDAINPQTILDTLSDVSSFSYVFNQSGVFAIRIFNPTDCPNTLINTTCAPVYCETCIGSFSPIPGNDYLVGAWVKEPAADNEVTSYLQPQLFIDFTIDDGVVTPYLLTEGPFTATGAIIDGWQRIEEVLSIHPDAVDMEIRLSTLGEDVLFDDIRFFPFDASMKTFVYDPVNMRLAAELDERHYATFYEYDEEGKLVRIKKETEKGIMTIQETKSNSSKKGQ